jgi:hypothetical protein
VGVRLLPQPESLELRRPGCETSTGDQTPKPIDPSLLWDVDFVITLGRDAHVDPVPGPRFETWDTDEPSQRGIDGIERMRLIRNDITAASLICYAALRLRPSNPCSTGSRRFDAPEGKKPAR